jgi:hypothetical protein
MYLDICKCRRNRRLKIRIDLVSRTLPLRIGINFHSYLLLPSENAVYCFDSSSMGFEKNPDFASITVKYFSPLSL